MKFNKKFYKNGEFWVGLISLGFLIVLMLDNQTNRFGLTWWIGVIVGIVALIYFLYVGVNASDFADNSKDKKHSNILKFK